MRKEIKSVFILYLTLFFFLNFLLGCKRIHVGSGGLSGDGSYRLSPNLVVNKTSATTFTLCDADGLGLVEGSLLKIHLDKPRGMVIASFVSFAVDVSEPNNIAPSEIKIAVGRVDPDGKLKEGQIEILSYAQASEKYGREIRAMKDVQSFFP